MKHKAKEYIEERRSKYNFDSGWYETDVEIKVIAKTAVNLALEQVGKEARSGVEDPGETGEYILITDLEKIINNLKI